PSEKPADNHRAFFKGGLMVPTSSLPLAAASVTLVSAESYAAICARLGRFSAFGGLGGDSTLDVYASAEIPDKGRCTLDAIVTRGQGFAITTVPMRRMSPGDGPWLHVRPEQHQFVEGYLIFAGDGLDDFNAAGFMVKTTDRQVVRSIHERLYVLAIANG